MQFFTLPKTRAACQALLILSALILSAYVNAQPVINSFSPAAGPTGSTITITGSNFSSTPSDNIVYFGGVRSTVFTATSTSLTVTVPTGAGYQPISVTVNNLTGYSARPFIVTFGSGANPFDANSFGGNEGFGALGENQGFCVADFDGDNKLDMIVGSTPDNKVLAFRNTSSLNNISFAAPWIEIPTLAAPTQLAAADIDGDGKTDLLTLNSGSVSVYKNTSTRGNISFAARVNFNVGASLRMPTVADFDMDGKPDLAIVYSASIAVLRNTSSAGTINFATAVTLTAGLAPIGIASGDLDGDGKPDLGIANSSSNNVSVFRNTSVSGSISFAPKTDFATANGPRGITLADIDGDNLLDMAVASRTGNTVSVFRNTSVVGTIGFDPRVNFAAISPEMITASDLDGDGKVDLSTPSQSGNNVSLFKNASTPGTVSFLTRVDYAVGFTPVSVITADISGDGQPELCAIHLNSGVWVMKNKLPGLASSAPPAISNVSPASAKPTTTLTITGSNFTDASAVSFGGTPATSFLVISPTTITAVLGLGAPGNVVVTTPNGTANYSGFTFITPDPPTITSFSPVTTTANRLVTITGTDFYGVTAVTFGGVAATSFTVVSPTTIVARTAYGSSGSVGVTTVYGSGSTPGYTYNPPLTVTSFSPLSGPAGTAVTINGTNFSANPAENIVYFGAVKATVTAATTTALTVTVPNGATHTPISVTTDGFKACTTLPFAITYPGGDDAFEPASFDVKKDFATVGPVRGLTLADFDGDGKPDLTASIGWPLSDNSVDVWKNQSTLNNVAIGARQVLINNTSSSTYGYVVDDFEGDGKPDVMVSSGNTLSAFKNTSNAGTISFAPKVDFTGNSPGALVTADLDRDGRPDIIGSGSDGFSFTVHRNLSVDGQIVMSSRIGVPAPEALNGLAVGDLNGDGLPDILTTNYQSGSTLSIYKNTSTIGNISFAARTNQGIPHLAANVLVSDLDADGRPDVIVTAGSFQDEAGISVFRNTSTGAAIILGPRIDLPRTMMSGGLKIADLNGDGRPELFAHNLDSSAVAVYRNTSTPGNISFATYVKYSIPRPYSAVLGDMDGDAKPEIIAGNFNGSFTSGTISVLRNKINDPGSLLSFTPDSASYGETVTITGTDFTGATKVSFGGVPALSFSLVNSTTITAVVGAGASGNVAVGLPTGLATRAGFKYIPATITSFSPAADTVGATVTITGLSFDPDAARNTVYFGSVKATVLTASSTMLTVRVPAGSSNRPISVTSFGYTAYSGKPFYVKFPGGFNVFAANSFAPKYNITVTPDPQHIVCGDLDGDGKAEIVMAAKNKGVSIYQNRTTVNTLDFYYLYEFTIGTNIISVDVADINGDGKLDVVAANPGGAGMVVLINKGPTSTGLLSFMPAQNVNADPANPFWFVKAADINRDGRIDVAGASRTPDMLSVFKRTSAESSTFITTPDVSLVASPGGMTAGDIDGDLKADMIIMAQHGVSVFRNTSSQDNITFAARADVNTTYPPTGVSVTDVNGDGKNDLVITHYNASISSSATVSVFLNTSTSGTVSFAAPVDYALTENPLGVEAGDMDGDGKPDLVLFNETNVIVMKNRSTSSVISFAAGVSYGAGLHTSAVALCDINRDGLPDIVYTDANGNLSTMSVLKNVYGRPSIVPSGGRPVTGPVGSNVIVDPTAQMYNGTVYVPRHYDIIPEVNPATSTATVTLYFTQEDFDNFNAHPAHGPDLPVNPTDNAGKANLRVHQYHGFSATGIPGTYSGPAEIIDPADNNIVWNAAAERWEVTFDVNGFSGFFISNVGAQIVPLKLLSFTGIPNGKDIVLQWSTAREMDVRHFELERSVDGAIFTFINRTNALNGNIQQYQYTDHPPASVLYYYRLKLVDKDGSFSYSKVIAVKPGAGINVINITPNPVRGSAVVSHPAGTKGSELKLVDMNGRVIKRTPVQQNAVQTRLNLHGVVAGMYTLVWHDGANNISSIMVVE
jgi:hypothetical protein